MLKTSKHLGEAAANYVADILKKAIAKNGSARIVLSTGESQFDTIEALIKTDVDWNKVEMFHLDEYLNLPDTHVASFRRYLNERFIRKVKLKAIHLVDNHVDCISKLTKEISERPIDIGLIGIGENAHIAFNDPPANFDTNDAYIIVNLSETCKRQQVREGWFPTVDDVPKQAITMSVHQILQCNKIISCVPHAVKSKAIKETLENDLNNMIPATILKYHKDFTLFLDTNSASQISEKKIKKSENDDDFSYEQF